MSMSKGEQPVEDGLRDKAFAELRAIQTNNVCVDCQKKNPRWASIHLGLHLCIDCAGIHRQYGAMNSLVKSTNLDTWNHKQLLFMQKGGNTRALEYFRKVGLINESNSRIDYKSPLLQKYKALLTAEVESELTGKPLIEEIQPVKKQENGGLLEDKSEIKPTMILPTDITTTVVVEENNKPSKKKKEKKKLGKQINIELFDNMEFDDGVPREDKTKNENTEDNSNNNPKESIQGYSLQETIVEKENTSTQLAPPQEMSAEEVKQKMEEIKSTNTKTISSDAFKDYSNSNTQIKQTLNKLSNSSSISSAALFNEPQESEVIDKIKDVLTDASDRLIGKIKDWGWKK